LAGEIQTRRKKNVVQARSFAELLEQSIRKYQNRAIETVEVIEELIGLAKEINAAQVRGHDLGLTDDEVAFYDALETNEKEEVWLAGRLWDAMVPLLEGKTVQIDMRAGQFGELERRLRLSEDFQIQTIDYTTTRR
jgi:type I site-specific restriction-modification system R (restriction) subunit